MSVIDIYNHLFKVAKTSHDPEGVVVACIVRDDKILTSSASSDDGVCHAEYLVIKNARKQNIKLDKHCILYTTLEPCSDLPNANNGKDCTSVIIESGIKHVVFAASDPEYSTKARERFKKEDIECTQIDDSCLIDKSKLLFNSTIKKNLNDLKLPRKKVL